MWIDSIHEDTQYFVFRFVFFFEIVIDGAILEFNFRVVLREFVRFNSRDGFCEHFVCKSAIDDCFGCPGAVTECVEKTINNIYIINF